MNTGTAEEGVFYRELATRLVDNRTMGKGRKTYREKTTLNT
jgi:hypothetical protein